MSGRLTAGTGYLENREDRRTADLDLQEIQEHRQAEAEAMGVAGQLPQEFEAYGTAPDIEDMKRSSLPGCHSLTISNWQWGQRTILISTPTG
jgi:hypothetical protein